MRKGTLALQQLKRFVKVALGRELWLRTEIDVPTEHHGSGYGKWTIQAASLGRDSVVYSFGVGEDVSFDLALLEGYGCTVHAFDPTPRSIAWAQAQRLPPGFVLHEYGIADHDGVLQFYPPADPAHISHTLLNRPETATRAIKVPVRRLSTIMAELGHGQIDLLKLDIEGAEYAVIDDVLASGLLVRQLLVEFHHRFKTVGLGHTREAIRSLSKHGYQLFAFSGEECSFTHV